MELPVKIKEKKRKNIKLITDSITTPKSSLTPISKLPPTYATVTKRQIEEALTELLLTNKKEVEETRKKLKANLNPPR